ncbi:MAG: type I DNA topoisomerase [Rikenellaceae bacterium]
MQENLVIVESPKKANTIAQFLGPDFIVKSSRGHIRDLAKKDLGIDIEDQYTPVYEISSDKSKVVDELKKISKSVKNVWLASDEDREGEAIAWHLAQVLDLPIDQTKRIVFHEITKEAILKAIENPRTINMNLVNAQQARRVLDRLVGFELSPVLWRKVRPQLSAGRVQSVTVRLIVEREREIIAFEPKQYFRVVAQFQKAGASAKSTFKAELSHRLDSIEQAKELLAQSIGATYSVAKVEEKPLKRYSAAPFTTSTLQQEAGRKLSMSVSQIMSVAQKLYEQGLITYMRTDSVNLSSQAIEQCKAEIIKDFGAEYSAPKNYKTKSKGAQEAHEAIRPSYIDRKTIDGTAAEKRLYDLIWKRTVASQMVPAELDRTVITIEQDAKDVTFTTTGEVVRFDGFMRLYTEAVDEDTVSDDNKHTSRLPKVVVGEALNSLEITATERYTQSPARYSEMTMVKKLEELGIGRPSTYMPTISTVIARGYALKQSREAVKREYQQLSLTSGVVSHSMLSENVGKEKDRLSPTDIGMLVNDYLEVQFAEIIDYNFTANVEKEFDRVAEGEVAWNTMIDDFYKPFHSLVDSAVGEQVARTTHERILGTDPKTGREVKARIGRYGAMVEIVAPEGEKPKYAGLKAGQLIESISLKEALSLFDLPRTLGEFEGHALVVGIGRFGPYVRQDKSFTSLAKTDDPYAITLERAIELIVTTRVSKAAANTPIKTFEQDADLIIKNGRYGPYIAYNKKNYRIPKSRAAEELTFEECQEIIAKSKK